MRWRIFPPDTDFYRVRFRDLSHTESDRTGDRPLPHRARRPCATSALSGAATVAGQGWGINPDDAGMFTFADMRKYRRIFCCIPAIRSMPRPDQFRVTLADGKVGRPSPSRVAKVAETLDEVRVRA